LHNHQFVRIKDLFLPTMKKLISLLIVLSSITGISQELITSIEVRPAFGFGKTILREKVLKATRFEDLIPYYPHSWIEDYIGTTITVNHNNSSRSSEGINNNLTGNQKSLLTNARIGDELTLSIKYQSKNSVTGDSDKHEIKLEFTVVTDQDAKPAAGIDKLRDYFKVNTFKEFADGTGDAFAGASVIFIIDVNGNISDANLKKSSGNLAADLRLLKSVRNMPLWMPAQDKSGKKYSREFVLEVVKSGC